MKRSLAAYILLALVTVADAATLTGKVVGVADGDTVTVLDANREQHKIRLQGIDAPERKQAFGERSRQNLAAMVFNKMVSVEWDKQDKYGRTVGKVIVNGVDANLEQIKAGMAWWYENAGSNHRRISADTRRQSSWLGWPVLGYGENRCLFLHGIGGRGSGKPFVDAPFRSLKLGVSVGPRATLDRAR